MNRKSTGTKKDACLFDKNELVKLIGNREIFACFKLIKKERQILILRLERGFTFKIIAGIYNVSRQRIHRIYLRALEKMKNQFLEALLRNNEKKIESISPCQPQSATAKPARNA